MIAVMTAQSLEWRFCQSTGAGSRIFSPSRESNSFFKLYGDRQEKVVGKMIHPHYDYSLANLPWRDERCVLGIGRRSTGPPRWSPGLHPSGWWRLLRRTAARTGTPQCSRTGRSEDAERGVAITQPLKHYNKRAGAQWQGAASLWHTVPNSYSVVWAESVPLVKRGCASSKCVSVPLVLGEMSSCPVCESH